MSFHDEVLREQRRDRRCGLGDAIRSMDPKFAQEVTDALRDPSLQATAIARKLKDLGYQVNRFQVRDCPKNCECGAINGNVQ